MIFITDLKKFIKNNPEKITWLLSALFIAVGLLNFWIHRDIPIIRNALVYARITDNIIDYGSGFVASEHGYIKPLGFTYLAVPLVKFWGLNVGLKVLSAIIAGLWTVSLIPFFKRFSDRFGIGEKKNMVLYILLLCFNPLVIYQFMSAYPDLLFALTFIWAIYFLDRFLSKDGRWFDGLLFSIISLLSVWVKHNGFILIPILLVSLIFRFNYLKKIYRERSGDLIIFAISLIGFFTVVGLAQAGYDFNLFNLGYNTENYTSGDDRLHILGTNLSFFAIYLGLTLGAFTPLVFHIKKKDFLHNKEWFVIFIIFICSLLFYRGTSYNIRYYLTISPFFVFLVLKNFQRLRSLWKRVLIISFLAVNLLTILFYNSLWFNEKVVGSNTDIGYLDNLRLVTDQRKADQNIEKINELHQEQGYQKLILISDYYGDAKWYVWEESGLFAEDLEIYYYKKWNLEILSEYRGDKLIIYGGTEELLEERSIQPNLQKRTGSVYTLDF